jgi:hypothetical protein
VEYFVAIDVSLKLSSVCVVDGTGKIVREGKVASEPRIVREDAVCLRFMTVPGVARRR